MSLNPHGPFLRYVTTGMIVDIPLQDGATYGRARVLAANDSFFIVEFETLFPGKRERYPQGMRGVALVSDG